MHLPLSYAQKSSSQVLHPVSLQITPFLLKRDHVTVNLCARAEQKFEMAAVTNTAELVRMLNKGQDELRRSIHDLNNNASKAHDKKTSFKMQKPTRKRARTQQLYADQVCRIFHIVMCILNSVE